MECQGGSRPDCGWQRPPKSVLRIYQYNVSLLTFGRSEQEQADYDSIVGGKLPGHLHLVTLGVREAMHAERFLTGNFGRRVRIVSRPEEADLMWMPLWPYGVCTAIGELGKKQYVFHKQQSMSDVCPTMLRVYEWLYQQLPWKRSQGADHVVFANYKDRWARYTRFRNDTEFWRLWMGRQRTMHTLIANSILVTHEDRLPQYPHRKGCSSVVVPYFADPQAWGRKLSFAQLLAGKRSLLAFYGNSKGYSCHLEHGACPVGYNRLVSDVRKAIIRAAQRSNGSALDLRRKSEGPATDAGARMLRETTFCPCPAGDTWTSKRLYTAILSVCIPIILSDGIQLPFDTSIPWSSFSLRLSQKSVAHGQIDLVEFARNVSRERVASMQRALWRAGRWLSFDESHTGGTKTDATALMIAQLEDATRCSRPVLMEKFSDAPCVFGHSFGLTSGSGATQIWTHPSCRGSFASLACLRRERQQANLRTALREELFCKP